MFVYVLADDAAKLSDLRGILDRRSRVAAERLDVDVKLSPAPHAMVIRADPCVIEKIAVFDRCATEPVRCPLLYVRRSLLSPANQTGLPNHPIGSWVERLFNTLHVG